MVVGLLRHGSRDPGKSDCRGFERLQEILGQLPEGNKWRGWRNRYDCKRVHSLVQEGMIEHHGIGMRMAKRFPRLFGNYSSGRHKIMSSHLERSSRSAASFAHGAWGGTGPSEMGGYQPVHIQTPSPSTKDLLLRFVDHCPLYEQIIDHRGGLSERDAFLRGEEVGRAAARISARANMPHGQVLSNKEAFSIYTACGFELAHGVKDGLCGLLGEEDVETFEYLDDLKHYYKKAGGHAVNREMACPLLHHMVGALEARANGSSPESTHLMFAHAETLVPLLTRLGLFDGDAHLTSDLDSEKRRKRIFRSSSVTPMAANLFLALYQCSDGPSHVVRAWLNEKPIRIPRCHDSDDYEHGDGRGDGHGDGSRGECPLRLLVERHVANEECSFDHSCGCDGSEGGGEEVCGKGRRSAGADRDCTADRPEEPKSNDTPLASAWPTSIDHITLSSDALSLALATAVASMAVAGAMAWAFMKI